jgi:hypothetical protein
MSKSATLWILKEKKGKQYLDRCSTIPHAGSWLYRAVFTSKLGEAKIWRTQTAAFEACRAMPHFRDKLRPQCIRCTLKEIP